jgi:hypothetical protein
MITKNIEEIENENNIITKNIEEIENNIITKKNIEENKLFNQKFLNK